MRRLILPSLLILAAFLFHRSSGGADTSVPWTLASRIGAGLVFLLAWRLRRGRVAWWVVALAAAAESLEPVLGGFEPTESQSADLRLAVGLLLPLAVAVLAWTAEFWVTSTAGLWRWVGLIGVALAAWGATLAGARPLLDRIVGFAGGNGGVESSGGETSLVRLAASFGTVPSVLLVFTLGLVLCSLALWRRRTPVEAGLLGALVAAGFAYARPEDLRYFVLAAVVVLGASLVENAFVLAFHDGLTGLPARRALEERLAQVGRTYALAMLDLDHFKKFNDKHGHEVGDQVLKLVASRLQRVSGGGEAFRYGGEEFTVVFAGRSAAEAKAHMDALREDIAGRSFTVRSPGRPGKKPKGKLPGRTPMVTKQLKVTVSIGVAERNEKYASVDEVMKAADKALYQSKKAGRNRVSVAK